VRFKTASLVFSLNKHVFWGKTHKTGKFNEKSHHYAMGGGLSFNLSCEYQNKSDF